MLGVVAGALGGCPERHLKTLAHRIQVICTQSTAHALPMRTCCSLKLKIRVLLRGRAFWPTRHGLRRTSTQLSVWRPPPIMCFASHRCHTAAFSERRLPMNACVSPPNGVTLPRSTYEGLLSVHVSQATESSKKHDETTTKP